MDSITAYLTNNRKHCDKVFVEAVVGVSTEVWDRAENSFRHFSELLAQHIAMEEKVLFRALDTALDCIEPTALLRNEHRQVRGIIAMLQDALNRRDKNAFLGHSETLNLVLQQHNQKEESILFVMADRELCAQKRELIKSMSDIAAAH